MTDPIPPPLQVVVRGQVGAGEVDRQPLHKLEDGSRFVSRGGEVQSCALLDQRSGPALASRALGYEARPLVKKTISAVPRKLSSSISLVSRAPRPDACPDRPSASSARLGGHGPRGRHRRVVDARQEPDPSVRPCPAAPACGVHADRSADRTSVRCAPAPSIVSSIRRATSAPTRARSPMRVHSPGPSPVLRNRDSLPQRFPPADLTDLDAAATSASPAPTSSLATSGSTRRIAEEKRLVSSCKRQRSLRPARPPRWVQQPLRPLGRAQDGVARRRAGQRVQSRCVPSRFKSRCPERSLIACLIAEP